MGGNLQKCGRGDRVMFMKRKNIWKGASLVLLCLVGGFFFQAGVAQEEVVEEEMEVGAVGNNLLVEMLEDVANKFVEVQVKLEGYIVDDGYGEVSEEAVEGWESKRVEWKRAVVEALNKQREHMERNYVLYEGREEGSLIKEYYEAEVKKAYRRFLVIYDTLKKDM